MHGTVTNGRSCNPASHAPGRGTPVILGARRVCFYPEGPVYFRSHDTQERNMNAGKGVPNPYEG